MYITMAGRTSVTYKLKKERELFTSSILDHASRDMQALFPKLSEEVTVMNKIPNQVSEVPEPPLAK
jgi:hypothetical protein